MDIVVLLRNLGLTENHVDRKIVSAKSGLFAFVRPYESDSNRLKLQVELYKQCLPWHLILLIWSS